MVVVAVAVAVVLVVEVVTAQDDSRHCINGKWPAGDMEDGLLVRVRERKRETVCVCVCFSICMQNVHCTMYMQRVCLYLCVYCILYRRCLEFGVWSLELWVAGDGVRARKVLVFFRSVRGVSQGIRKEERQSKVKRERGKFLCRMCNVQCTCMCKSTLVLRSPRPSPLLVSFCPLRSLLVPLSLSIFYIFPRASKRNAHG